MNVKGMWEERHKVQVDSTCINRQSNLLGDVHTFGFPPLLEVQTRLGNNFPV